MKLQQIITEVVIPMGENKAIFSTCRAKIRVGDQGGGPYLLVEGCNDGLVLPMVVLRKERRHEDARSELERATLRF